MVVVWCMHILYMCLIVSKNKFFNWERQSVDHVWFNLSFPYLYIHVFREIYTVVVVTRPIPGAWTSMSKMWNMCAGIG